jgi:putative component of membrane protein insertase Oxa1/YidC/SpoIIIJ protein YidD
MEANWLDSGLGQIATTAIGGYQKYVSPHKGFSCAHRLLYGGESCSQYVKGAIAQNGLSRAIDCGSGLDCSGLDCGGCSW